MTPHLANHWTRRSNAVDHHRTENGRTESTRINAPHLGRPLTPAGVACVRRPRRRSSCIGANWPRSERASAASGFGLAHGPVGLVRVCHPTDASRIGLSKWSVGLVRGCHSTLIENPRRPRPFGWRPLASTAARVHRRGEFAKPLARKSLSRSTSPTCSKLRK